MSHMTVHPSTRRPHRMPRAEREAQILAIAEVVFAERGYQSTTMEEVAERVGVTKPMIYEHFGSKVGLLNACIASARTQLQQATEAAWRSLPAGSTHEDSFRAGIRAFFDFIDGHINAFALIQTEAAIQQSASVGVERIRQQQTGKIVELLHDQLGLTHMPTVVLEGFAEVVVGACERVAVWRIARGDVSAQDATDLVMTAVWTGLASLIPTMP